MSDLYSYLYNKNGLRVKYTLEHQYIEDQDSWLEDSGCMWIPPEFMPAPEFEKRTFFQTVKYRIRTLDLLGIKEVRRREEILRAHRDKRYYAWCQKLENDKKKRELEIEEACTPENLRKTGVEKLLLQIQNAKDIDINGTRLDLYDEFYQEVELSWIDGMKIDLGKQCVMRDGTVVLSIPDIQLRPVYEAIQGWRGFAIKHGEYIR